MRQHWEEIGLFDNALRHRSWEDNYIEAKRHCEAMGNVEIPHDYVSEDGLWLGRWMQAQRRRLRSGVLTAEQIERLNAIGTRWDAPWKTRWYAYLEAVRGYPRNTAGAPAVPKGIPHNARGPLAGEYQPPAACKNLDYPPGNLRFLQFAID